MQKPHRIQSHVESRKTMRRSRISFRHVHLDLKENKDLNLKYETTYRSAKPSESSLVSSCSPASSTRSTSPSYL